MAGESEVHSPGLATEFIAIADEYTPVPNSFVEQLARVRLKPHDYQVILFIMRKTLGWAKNKSDKHLRKKTDVLALSQMSSGTCLDRRRVHEALIRLRGRRIIVVRSSQDRKPKRYGLNFNLSEWSLSPPVRTERSVRYVTDRMSGRGRTALSPPVRTGLSTPSAHTKETPKETSKETPKERTHPRPQGPSGGDTNNQENSRKSFFGEYLEARAQSKAPLSYSEWIHSLSAPER